MPYIDLHVHSNQSDGTLCPSEVVNHAIKHHLNAIALTDHDTLQGLEEAIQASNSYKNTETPIQVIPGVELSVSYEKQDIHILGLFVDYSNKLLHDTLKLMQLKREERNIKMANNLFAAGIDISIEKLKKEEGNNTIITRAHFANYLTKYHYTKTMKDAFTYYLNSKGPYYVSRDYMKPKEAIELLHQAKGLAVLAHPLLYKLQDSELESLVNYLKKAGLDAIEAIYSSNTILDENKIRKLANKYELLITGGSDFHGANKPQIQIGTGHGNLKIPVSILESLQQYQNNRRYP